MPFFSAPACTTGFQAALDASRTGWKPVVRTRKGFTFTEILFAVLILGIGFILIAAIFPVALKQTQTSGEETVAATIGKEGVSYLSKYNAQSYWATGTGTPATPDGYVHPIGPDPGTTTPPSITNTNTLLWPLISGNLILPSDNRYAWVPMYRQGVDSSGAALPYIQLIIIGVKARNRTNYDGADLIPRGPAGNGVTSLQARPLIISSLTQNSPSGGADTVTLTDVPSEPFLNCAAEGAYLVVANDPGNKTNGWIYRLGNLIGSAAGPPATVTYELAPGNDFGNSPPPTPNSAVLVIGRGYDDGNATTYSGPAQDITAYTTFINVQ